MEKESAPLSSSLRSRTITRRQTRFKQMAYSSITISENRIVHQDFMMMIQNQIINTKNHGKYIIKDPRVTDDRCRKCHIQWQTIQHITGACPNLAQTDYPHRHNQIANIHQRLAVKYKLIPDTHTPYYEWYIDSMVYVYPE